jgi:uncharacterized membrane protein
LWAGEREAKRAFPQAALARIEKTVSASETKHRGELRVVIEGGFGWAAASLHSKAKEGLSRARAVELFSALRVWDTQDNSGVLIYILMAERKLEIVADRGIHAQVGEQAWQAIAEQAARGFRDGAFEAGLDAVIAAITALLATHFPANADNPNELSDQPLRL